MNVRGKLLLASFAVGLALWSTAQGQERKIKRSDLPPAVEKTVKAESAGATIQGFSTEVERGKRLYEVELKVEGRGKDILIDRQGNVVEIEEEVALDSLPAAVREGLTKAAGRGTISRVESLTKLGKLVAYEAVVKTGARRREVQVGPNGERLARPE
ncbi:MAG: PepSY-like domain-containing protein [Acidobacteria bacterium]|nr:PepSY-like domain-containing protein [Acidobacteriota bacterium]